MKLKMKYMKKKKVERKKGGKTLNIYKKYSHDFQQYETMKSFRDNIYTHKINKV